MFARFMKYIKTSLLLCLIFLCGCNESHSEGYPRGNLIKRFSKRLNEETGAVLYRYASGPRQTEEEIERYGKESYILSYYFKKDQDDYVSLDEARCLLVSIVESFLKEVNADETVHEDLNVYPLTADWLYVSIYFKDENKINLGQGISFCSLWNDKIKYETFEIYEYSPTYPVKGKYQYIHEESYQDALKIVKEQKCLQDL